MSKAKVYVQGRAYNEITSDVFEDNGYTVVKALEDSDIIVWTGGDDIYPGLYNEKPIPGTYYNLSRDKSDLLAIEKGMYLNRFLVGICRGAQLLNVFPNGGTLWQDIDGHGGSNHKAFDCISGEWIIVNSVHHQALRVTPKAEIICWAMEAKKKQSEKEWILQKDIIFESDKDIEVAWYPETRSFCFQAHPEFGHPPTTEYFFKTMEKYFKKL